VSANNNLGIIIFNFPKLVRNPIIIIYSFVIRVLSENRKLLIKNTFINTFGFGIQVVLNILITGLLFRYLTIVEFASFALLNIFANQGLLSLFDFSIPTTILRVLSKKSAKNYKFKSHVIYNSVLFSIAVGVISSCLLVSLGDVISGLVDNSDPNFRLILLICCFLNILYLPSYIGLSILESEKQFLLISAFKVVLDISKSCLILYGFFNDFGYIFYCIVLVGSFALLALFYVYHLVFYLRNSKNSTYKSQLLVKLLFVSWPIYRGRFWSILFNNSDRVAASIIGGATLLAYSEIFTKLSFFLNRFLGIASSAVIPYAASIKKESRSDIYGIYLNILIPYSIFIISTAIFLLINTGIVIEIYSGSTNELVVLNARLMLLWSLIFPLYFGGNILIGLNTFNAELSNNRFLQSIYKLVSLVILSFFVADYAISLSYICSLLSLISLLKLYKLVFLDRILAVLRLYLKIAAVTASFSILIFYFIAPINLIDLVFAYFLQIMIGIIFYQIINRRPSIYG